MLIAYAGYKLKLRLLDPKRSKYMFTSTAFSRSSILSSGTEIFHIHNNVKEKDEWQKKMQCETQVDWNQSEIKLLDFHFRYYEER